MESPRAARNIDSLSRQFILHLHTSSILLQRKLLLESGKIAVLGTQELHNLK